MGESSFSKTERGQGPAVGRVWMFLCTYKLASPADPGMPWVLNTVQAAASSRGSPHTMGDCVKTSGPGFIST